jgi:hypothetical protein
VGLSRDPFNTNCTQVGTKRWAQLKMFGVRILNFPNWTLSMNAFIILLLLIRTIGTSEMQTKSTLYKEYIFVLQKRNIINTVKQYLTRQTHYLHIVCQDGFN